MDEDLFARRASSFGNVASTYAEHRPDYPAEGIRWVVSGAARPVRQVLDLAAGTGKLTAGLLALRFEVTAVEPHEGMLTELARRFPQVAALTGTAEAIPLPDGSVDAVLAGQAFHWFDRDRAMTEIGRVLRPGGMVGALWNHEDTRVEWVAGLVAVNHSSVSRSTSPRRTAFDDELPDHPEFGPFERQVFPHTQRRTIESMIATIGTHSHMLVISEEERAERLSRIRDYLESRQETAHGEFDLPITTTVFRGSRR